MIFLVPAKSAKTFALVASAVALPLLYGLPAANACQVALWLLAGMSACACAALQQGKKLRRLLWVLLVLSLAALVLERNEALHRPLFHWLQWFVLA